MRTSGVRSTWGTNSDGPTSRSLRMPPDERLDGLDLAGVHPDDRLVVDDDLVLLERLLEVAHDAAVERRARRTISSLVSRFVAYIWPSARARSSPGVSPSCGKSAQPIDASISTRPPSTRYGRRRALRRRPTSAAASSSLDVPSESTTNSSPPTRATVSMPRTTACEPLGDHAQDGVAGLVAADVVDALEPVEVDDEQRERLGRPLGARERLLDPVVEQRAVRQTGERVAEGEPLGGHQP